jgi:hypothetical protein
VYRSLPSFVLPRSITLASFDCEWCGDAMHAERMKSETAKDLRLEKVMT